MDKNAEEAKARAAVTTATSGPATPTDGFVDVEDAPAFAATERKRRREWDRIGEFAEHRRPGNDAANAVATETVATETVAEDAVEARGEPRRRSSPELMRVEGDGGGDGGERAGSPRGKSSSRERVRGPGWRRRTPARVVRPRRRRRRRAIFGKEAHIVGRRRDGGGGDDARGATRNARRATRNAHGAPPRDADARCRARGRSIFGKEAQIYRGGDAEDCGDAADDDEDARFESRNADRRRRARGRSIFRQASRIRERGIGARAQGRRRTGGRRGCGNIARGGGCARGVSVFREEARVLPGRTPTTIPVEGGEGGIPTTMTKTPASNRGTPTLAAELVGARFSGKRRKSSLADAKRRGRRFSGCDATLASGSRRAPSPRGRPRRPLRSREKGAF